MKFASQTALMLFLMTYFSCARTDTQETGTEEFEYQTDQFADLRILRYQVPGFENLEVSQKELIYYLYEAALSGRDIIWDQNYRHNLYIRKTLENIVESYSGDRKSEDWEKFMIYTKRIWFSNGIHHHYSTIKILPEFTEDFFSELVRGSSSTGFPLSSEETLDDLIEKLSPILFNPDVDGKKVNLDPETDLISTSATNYYDETLTQKEVEDYYRRISDQEDPQPISYGLNSKLVKTNGIISEKVWKVGGMYGQAIERVAFWLKKAASVAESPAQQAALEKLIEYYETGDLRKFDEYNILWLKDTDSLIDVINGFIEVYGDPLGYRGAYESVVSFRDMDATRRINALGKNAQWFEDNSPILSQHKKKEVTGISAKVITVAIEAGDASPSTPIGINLPNSNWIRRDHGSKSVNLGNIVNAYDESSKASGVLEEFSSSQTEVQRSKEHSTLASNLHTDMHEVIGHASGQMEPNVATPKETLKSYSSTLEEARADLVALYYQMDPKLIEIGVMDSLEVGRAGYDGYIRNGLMVQLVRLKPDENLEQAHMRNRQMISRWVYEKGEDRIIQKQIQSNQTYFVINDYEALRDLFGQLLMEVQRIKSQGDYEAGRNLVENYGVRVDRDLHKEILKRYAKLNRPPYAGFINPRLIPIKDGERIVDVQIEYPKDFQDQMMSYGKNYAFLPVYN